jgi:hypothetical protein
MRDSFHDDRLLDRVIREKFPHLALACREMSPETARQFVIGMRPAILREYWTAMAKAAD